MQNRELDSDEALFGIKLSKRESLKIDMNFFVKFLIWKTMLSIYSEGMQNSTTKIQIIPLPSERDSQYTTVQISMYSKVINQKSHLNCRSLLSRSF